MTLIDKYKYFLVKNDTTLNIIIVITFTSNEGLFQLYNNFILLTIERSYF